ncbi:phage portal protein [Streptomyces sp. H10-C2]|uniref:phage portal protein n=1 Tax=unclassified Streptomyces TaxID=2593676 RepID=UPI0024B8CE25|nr:MULTISPECIES: phage portal protein [unclassified Streptomyces]MDJ0342279.1 phage portal protein [Streptomyces sp. PH10-H1]MDJ0368793.1 phage portal protein [Streptomyces sp. H10-C2]
MGVRSWLRDTFRTAPVAETVTESQEVPTPAQVRRVGYEYGIALNPSTSSQISATSERQQTLSQLHQAYMACNWVSASVDLIARTITAGGIQIVAEDANGGDGAPAESPQVTRLRRLMRFVNPREDMVQLLRNVATDLGLFGDAYLEVVSLLGEPVALYGLDATTMTVISDLHGEVSGYVQNVDGVRQAQFKPSQVIHISLDAPRGGLYGVSPAQKALLPVTAWLFTMATLKECFRRGDPPRVHVDLQHFQDSDVQRWREQYRVNNLGPKAVGEPLLTTGGAVVQVLDARKVSDYLDADRQLRDQIIASFGVPPAKLGIIETGNLGSGSGEAQDKTFRVNTVIPIANLILEKLNFHLLQEGFGIDDWHLEFAEIDYRDSKVVEEIRKIRLDSGAYTINRWRAEIGEPPIDGGDDAIIMDRQGPVFWRDVPAMSKATIAWRVAPLTAAGVNGYVPGVPDSDLDLTPDPTAPAGDSPAVPSDPQGKPGLSKDAAQGDPPEEMWDDLYRRCLDEALARI